MVFGPQTPVSNPPEEACDHQPSCGKRGSGLNSTGRGGQKADPPRWSSQPWPSSHGLVCLVGPELNLTKGRLSKALAARNPKLPSKLISHGARGGAAVKGGGETPWRAGLQSLASGVTSAGTCTCLADGPLS